MRRVPRQNWHEVVCNSTMPRPRIASCLAMIVIATFAAILAGCVVAPAPGYYAYHGRGWCYYHPYRC
jgi:hypothetical protein